VLVFRVCVSATIALTVLIMTDPFQNATTFFKKMYITFINH
jgi:hypothetical protein